MNTAWQPIVLRYSTVLSGLLLFCAFVLNTHLSPSYAFFHDYVTFISLLFLLLVVLVSPAPVVLAKEALFITALVGIPLVQWLTGHLLFGGDLFLIAAYLLAAAGTVMCGASLYRYYGHRLLLALAVVWVAIGLFNSFVAVYQVLQLDYLGMWVRSAESARAFGNIGQANMLSSVLLVSLFFAAYLYEKRCIHRGVWWALCACLLVGLAFCQSRTPYLVAIVWAGLFVCYSRRFTLRLRLVDVALVLAMFWLANQVYGTVLEWGWQTEYQGRALVEGKGSSRLELWRGMVQAIVQQPWVGYGWGQAGMAQVLSGYNFELMNYARQSHNILLDLLVWNGIPLGLVIIIVTAIWCCKRVWFCRTVDQWLCLQILVAIGIHAMLELPLEYAFLLLPAALLVGVLTVEAHPQQPVEPVVVNKRWLVPVIPLMSVILWVLVHDYHAITHNYREAHLANVHVKGAYRPVDHEPDVLLLTHWGQWIKLIRTKPEELTADDLVWAKKVAHHFAFKPNLLKYAKACLLHGRYDEVERILTVARNIYVEDTYLTMREELDNLKPRPLP